MAAGPGHATAQPEVLRSSTAHHVTNVMASTSRTCLPDVVVADLEPPGTLSATGTVDP
jgi:hypothetical protein